MDVVTEEVSSQSVEGCPDNVPCGIEDQKARPAHAVGPGQKGGPGTQHRNVAPKEDHFALVLQEQILPQFEPAFFQADITPVAARASGSLPRVPPRSPGCPPGWLRSRRPRSPTQWRAGGSSRHRWRLPAV